MGLFDTLTDSSFGEGGAPPSLSDETSMEILGLKNLFKKKEKFSADQVSIRGFMEDVWIRHASIGNIAFDLGQGTTDQAIPVFVDAFVRTWDQRGTYPPKVQKALKDMMRSLRCRNAQDVVETIIYGSAIFRITSSAFIHDERRFRHYFDGVRTIDDLQVKHLYILGFLMIGYRYARFIEALVGIINPTGRRSDPPRYLEQDILKVSGDVTHVIQFCMKNANASFGASGHKGLERFNGKLYDLLQDLSRMGEEKDFRIKVGSRMLTDYVDPKDISSKTYEVLNAGLIMSVVWDAAMTLSKLRQDSRTRKKEWLESKISILALEMAEIDEDDPEYQKKKKIHEAYTNMVTDLEQKLRRYEQD